MALAPVSRSVVVTALVAAVVTVVALFVSFELREPATSAAPAGTQRPAEWSCRTKACAPIETTTVRGTQVQLLADQSRSAGELVAGENSSTRVTVTTAGAKLAADSLVCVESASGAACLVSGMTKQGRLGEVFGLEPSGAWDRFESSYLSDAGVLQIDAVGDRTIIMTVRRSCGARCDDGPYSLEVFEVATGRPLGCTAEVATKEQLPGWPKLRPSLAELTACD